MITVDPASVPQIRLSSGASMPILGLGTFGSDKYTSQQIAGAVVGAAQAGYRHFDCASVYRNEAEVGASLAKIQSSGIARREEMWITSKVWNDSHGDGQVIASCKQSLRDLQLDYLDLYLVHWPFPNYHAPGVSADSRDPHARPYRHEAYMQTWAQMETLLADGVVRHIGTSNMTIPKMDLLLRDSSVKPHASEMELHPHFQQKELFAYCKERNIAPIGYSPIGSPSRPERDRTPDDTVDMDDPVIVRAAQRLGVSPAVACILWGVQNGQAVIPFSVKPEQYGATIEAVADPAKRLTVDEMAAVAAIDRGTDARLIKGHVFLWEGAKDWRDLWDLGGRITS